MLQLTRIVKANSFINQNFQKLRSEYIFQEEQQQSVQIPKDIRQIVFAKLNVPNLQQQQQLGLTGSSSMIINKSSEESHVTRKSQSHKYDPYVEQSECDDQLLHAAYPSMKDIIGLQSVSSGRRHYPGSSSNYDQPRSARISNLPVSLSVSQDSQTQKNTVVDYEDISQRQVKLQELDSETFVNGTQSSINNTRHHQEFFEVLNQNTMTMTMGGNNQIGENTLQDYNFQNTVEAMIQKIEEDFTKKLREMEIAMHKKIGATTHNQDERVSQMLQKSERRVDDVRQYQDRLERKVKEVVEQNVSIKIQMDSFKAKQIQKEKQFSSLQNQVNIDFNSLQKRCDEMLHQARAEITQAFQTDTTGTNEDSKQYYQIQADIQQLQQILGDIDTRFGERCHQLEEHQREASDHRLMSVSMINILDERLNGQDTRVLSLEKMTKEIHLTVQKHKNKGIEKALTEKIEVLMNENKSFQDQVRTKILEIGTIIDHKCKKAVITAYESKLSKLESDIGEVLKLTSENCNNGNKKEAKVKSTSAGKGSYVVKNETAHLKKSLDELTKVVDKVKADNNKLSSRVQHIFDYLSSLEDKIEESTKLTIKSMKSPMKDSHQPYGGAGSMLHVNELSQFSPRRSTSTNSIGGYQSIHQRSLNERQTPDQRRDYVVHPMFAEQLGTGYRTTREAPTNDRILIKEQRPTDTAETPTLGINRSVTLSLAGIAAPLQREIPEKLSGGEPSEDLKRFLMQKGLHGILNSDAKNSN